MKSSFTLSKLIPLVFIFGIFFTFEVSAQQAKKISLQGFLKDANGKAVADGSQVITFKLYTQEAGGTAEWTEDQTLNVFGGVYSTHLGQITSLENLNWGAATYYVGVTVQGTELVPRTELTFAPYSLGSPKAQEVVCSGAVGDIKHSILNPDQFKAVNGDCWVPMDGGSMVGSKLATIIGGSSVPNAGGLFIRSQEFSNSTNYDDDRSSGSAIAQVQFEDYRSHVHYSSLSVSASGGTSANGEHTHITKISGRRFSTNTPHGDGIQPDDNAGSTSPAGNHSHSVSVSGSATGNTNPNGGNETRPDNMNFWVYIRIN